MKPALNEVPLPKYIAIEGPIGVGKTTLANKVAKTFNYDAFLEQPAENPFLKNFYRNPEQSALATQLFFLFQRMQQIQDLKQRSLFENVRVADFLIEKDIEVNDPTTLLNGLKLVGDYLDKTILRPNNLNYPNSRLLFLNTLK